MADLIGKVLDRKYQLVRLIGEGGMGSVYEAEHTRISRKVAVKMMHPETASEPESVQRFLREAEAASAIGHPNIIEIFDVGMEEDGIAYIVMELLNGVGLNSVIADQKQLNPNRAVMIILQILSALHAAHQKGIIHRDLKPENVFLSVNSRNLEEVKLLDFGVAKVQEAQEDSLRLTRTGTVLGTPSYLSPEQARGRKDIDERIDIWAAGVLLYQMLGGELPFKGDNYNEVLANVLIEKHRPLLELSPQLPEELSAAVDRALQKNRKKRFGSAAEMIEVLLPLHDQDLEGMSNKVLEVLRQSVPPPPGAEPASVPFVPPPPPVPEPAPGPKPSEVPTDPGAAALAPTLADQDIQQEIEQTINELVGHKRRGNVVSIVIGGVGAAFAVLVVLLVLNLIPASGDREVTVETVEAVPVRGAGTETKPPPPAKKKPAGKPGILRGARPVTVQVLGLPPNATITLGGKEVENPATVQWSRHDLPLKITAPGYHTYETTVTPDRNRRIALAMKKKAAVRRPAARTRRKPKKLMDNPFR
jgi:serine/threonine-protein kinase